VLFAIFAIGVLPVALDLAQPHGLFGITEYDDGVYFGASLRLISGVFPYRDFVLVQPPGIAIVLAPFAALSHLIGGRDALGVARIATAGVVGANAALVGYVLRRRGLIAMAIGGLCLAVFPTAYTADHTFLLEPFCVLFCLLGACAMFAGDALGSDRRCLLAGVCFGVAGTIKVFAIVPIVVLLVICLVVRRRAAWAFLAGIAAALVVFVLPFVVAAPSAFVHDVIASQLGRSTGRPTPLLNRLFALTGLAYASRALNPAPNVPSVPATTAPTAVASSCVAAIVALLAARLARGTERSALGWFIVASAVGVVAIALVPAAYYDHYAYFSAPFLALAIGAGACTAVQGVRRATDRMTARRRRTIRRSLAATVVGLIATGTALGLAISISSTTALMDRFSDPGAQVAAALPVGSCVITDAESLLVSAGRAGPGPDGCPAIVDPTGVWLTIDPTHPPVRAGTGHKSAALVAIWADALRRAQYVVLSGACAFRIPWTPALAGYFDTHFVKVDGPYGLAFRRGTATEPTERPTMRATCAATRAAT
jgi:hypothetical protein